MAFADTAMVIANLAANRGYRPMTTVDQTTHFMRAVSTSDVLADARVVRIGRTMSFGRVTLIGAPTTSRWRWSPAHSQCCRGIAGGRGPVGDVPTIYHDRVRIGRARFDLPALRTSRGINGCSAPRSVPLSSVPLLVGM